MWHVEVALHSVTSPPHPPRVWLSGFAASLLPKSPKFCLPYRWSEAHPRSHHGFQTRLTPVLRSWGYKYEEEGADLPVCPCVLLACEVVRCRAWGRRGPSWFLFC